MINKAAELVEPHYFAKTEAEFFFHFGAGFVYINSKKPLFFQEKS
jgi:hypothetical protein